MRLHGRVDGREEAHAIPHGNAVFVFGVMLGQPDGVGAAAGCEFQGRTDAKAGRTQDERWVGSLALEVAGPVAFVPAQSSLIFPMAFVPAQRPRIAGHGYALSIGRPACAQALVPPFTEAAPSKPWLSR